MKKLLLLLPFFGILVSPLPTRAADDGWTITNFASDLTIQTDGNVMVSEDISVDFADLSKHGMYRDIPFEYEDDKNAATYIRIEDIAVTQDGGKAEFEASYEGSYFRIKIGDADAVISGNHRYRIQYKATGILRRFEAYDELYWNVTGNGWAVPISKASATVHVPQPAIVQSSCYQGTAGNTGTCQALNGAMSAAFSGKKELQAGEGLTIAAGYTKGMVPLLTVSERPNGFSDFMTRISIPQVIASFALALLIGIATLMVRFRKHGRDGSESPARFNPVIVPEYESPNGLKPAEIGLLLDERADTIDVSATIVDLGVQGYLTITEVPKKWAFGSSNYRLLRTVKVPQGLRAYESLLLAKLFEGREEVLLSDLKATFYASLAEVKTALYKELVDQGLFPSSPQSVRNWFLTAGFSLIVFAIISVILGVAVPLSFLLGMGPALAIVGVVTITMSSAMPRRTVLGRELYQKARGYKIFLGATEKYRQPFFEKQNVFMDLLPYAIVFGVTEKLAKAMASMSVVPTQPGWYHGAYAFNPVVFAGSIQSFSKSLNTAMASTPAGSGSGGGGYSGGGFGGGGGGSW